ncbi:hypothetical protein [Halalkalicoccus sp. NIPERK01]|uniref:DUF7344 domain-containing protein n=1 Tax=Halalkalicoccus sp. NIPERK01 TaxID=3053469 RepID=UPI00256E9F37|nr:hypothetical protein [Halalkalicoccus sp. NIPERK01]MDL5360589.1 hypothetical protein [Halalkalicoccus sp. NIPERK01]
MSAEPLTPTRSTGTRDLVGRVPDSLRAFVRSEHRLEKEEVFDLLYNPRRRATLQLLARRDRPRTMDDLVDRIAAEENDVPIDELERQQRRRVHVSLYQTHLPLLDSVDAIEYDPETKAVAPGACLEELLPYLDVPGTTRVPWRTYYGRVLAGYACLGAVVLGGLVGALSLSTLALVTTVLFLALALVQGSY